MVETAAAKRAPRAAANADGPANGAPAAGESAPAPPASQKTRQPQETLLTLAEAARTVGLSERALRKHIQRGKLASRTVVRGGRAVAAVGLEELERRYGSLRMVPTARVTEEGADAPLGTRLRSTLELSQGRRLKALARAQRVLEQRNGRLKALLGMERVQKQELQRQMQFLADSLARTDARLEAARTECQRLNRELGVALGRVAELERAGLAAPAAPASRGPAPDGPSEPSAAAPVESAAAATGVRPAHR